MKAITETRVTKQLQIKVALIEQLEQNYYAEPNKQSLSALMKAENEFDKLYSDLVDTLPEDRVVYVLGSFSQANAL